MRFNATGELKFNSLESKLPWKREGKTKKGDKYTSLNIAVASTKSNRLMTEIFGMMQDEIKTMDTDNEKISIDWDDRNDPEVIKKVASYKKHIANIDGDDRKEFIADYDFVKYLVENVDDLKDGLYTITGTSQLNEYNGKLSQRFQIQNIYKAADDVKKQLKVTFDFYYTASGIDLSDWKEEKKIRISGYTTAYVASEKKNMYVAQDAVIDASKIQFDNPKHVKLLEFKLRQLGLGLEDGKPVNNLKKNKVFKMQVICSYFNGAEEVEITPDMLSENQKMALELGLKTLDSFKDATVYGDRIIEYKIVDFNLKNEYADGFITLDEKPSEFEEMIYTPVQPETEADVLEKETSGMNPPEIDDDDDDIGDLFD